MPASNRPRVKDAVERFLARVRHNIDVHLETLGTDLVRALEEEGGKVSADRLSDLAKSASTVQAQEGKLDVLAKLVGSMRMQDEATTLRGIIEALARGAAGEAARVAVLLVDGDTLRSFAEFGYAGGSKPADVSLDSFPALARAVTDRQRLPLVAGTSGRVPERARVHARAARPHGACGPDQRRGPPWSRCCTPRVPSGRSVPRRPAPRSGPSTSKFSCATLRHDSRT
jgi:hypothetical protein